MPARFTDINILSAGLYHETLCDLFGDNGCCRHNRFRGISPKLHTGKEPFQFPCNIKASGRSRTTRTTRKQRPSTDNTEYKNARESSARPFRLGAKDYDHKRSHEGGAGGQNRKSFSSVFHIPWNFIRGNGRRVTDRVLQNALDHLNKAFTAQSCCDPALSWCETGSCSTNSNIRFVMATKNLIGQLTNDVTEDVSDSKACVSRLYNPLWSRTFIDSFLERSMKSALHKGDATVLNIYVTKVYEAINLPALLGHATFPWQYASQPKQDGVMVHPSALPGKDGSEGDALVHEVGHWLGLFNTYHGFCNEDDGYGGSDGIPDTASENKERIPKERLCDIGRNTCPLQEGEDPIHNFMDFSSDVCQYMFTPGQIDVMHVVAEAYRTAKQTSQNLPIVLVNGVTSAPQILAAGQTQVFQLQEVVLNSTIYCKAETSTGELNMVLNWDGKIQYAYQSATPDRLATRKEARILSGSGTVHAVIWARKTLIGYSVFCTNLTVPNPVELAMNSAEYNLAAHEVVAFTFDTNETDLRRVECNAFATDGNYISVMSGEEEADRTWWNSENHWSKVQMVNTFSIWLIADTATSGLRIQCVSHFQEAILLTAGVESGPYDLTSVEEKHVFAISTSGRLGFITCVAHPNVEDFYFYLDWVAGRGAEFGSTFMSKTQKSTIGPGNGVAFVTASSQAVARYTIMCDFEYPIELKSGIPSPRYSFARTERFSMLFYINVPSNSFVHCETTGNRIRSFMRGDVNLLMNWDGDAGTNMHDGPGWYDCLSLSPSPNEHCRIGPGPGTAYAIVQDLFGGFSITCTIE